MSKDKKDIEHIKKEIRTLETSTIGRIVTKDVRTLSASLFKEIDYLQLVGKVSAKEIDYLQVSDLLMNDEHYLVLKGYGWMLKELSKHEPKMVIDYLKKHKDKMPRTAFRYALEKLDAESRKELMDKE